MLCNFSLEKPPSKGLKGYKGGLFLGEVLHSGNLKKIQRD